MIYQFLFTSLILMSGSLSAAPPSEPLIRSCLQDRSADPSVTIHDLPTTKIIEEDDYANGFNAPYFFEYEGKDIGYAESDSDQAIIFDGRLYYLTSADTLGDNRDLKPSAFTPSLADWSFADERGQRYLCVSFNFDGLGRSGNFQKVHGGYLLNIRTKKLYYAVRHIEPTSP